MPKDPLTLRAEEHGCNSCGKRGDVFYAVQFYILPSRLVRQRHRDRSQTALYCRDCYEDGPDLSILIDDHPASVAKTPAARPEQSPCICCRSKTAAGNTGLYGMITSDLMMGGSFVECPMLAFVCANCVEVHEISLVAKL